LIVHAILNMENRELGEEPADARSNPVLEWDRLAKAGISYAGGKLGLPLRLEGGSTLATQLEKYRHSAHGRTDSLAEKLRQITGASLKTYRSGTDTRAARREIVLDYLNTMPLAAVPGYGEIHGLGEGLHAWVWCHSERGLWSIAISNNNTRESSVVQAGFDVACIRASSHLLLGSRPTGS
jgi:membrane peptidoglycan carboxypeptidase